MATTISTQDIVDAKRDIDDIGKAVNEKVIVSPRYGDDFKSLPMAMAELEGAIEAAAAAGAGENGWTDLLVLTQDGTTQRAKNTSFQSQINGKASAAYLNNALDEQTQTVNTALSQLSTAAAKFYPTLAAANADIANIAIDQPVQVGESGANGGLWYKATAGATSLTKSDYDPLTQAKDYTDQELAPIAETLEVDDSPSLLEVKDNKGEVVLSLSSDANLYVIGNDKSIQQQFLEQENYNRFFRAVNKTKSLESHSAFTYAFEGASERLPINKSFIVDSRKEHDTSQYPRIPSIIPLANNKLLFFWQRNIGAPYNGDAEGPVAYKRILTYDDSYNIVDFGTEEVFAQTVDPAGSSSAPMLTRTNSGRILAISVQRHTPWNFENEGANRLEFQIRYSDDEGETFSDPVILPDENEHGTIYQAGTGNIASLSTGRIVFPVYYVTQQAAGVIYSDDDGENWTASSNIVRISSGALQEPAIAVDEHDNIYLSSRHSNPTDPDIQMKKHFIKSTDGGVTLEDMGMMEDIISPKVASSMWYDKERKLLLHSSPSMPGRYDLRVYISGDKGASWKHYYNPFPVGTPTGYTHIVKVSDDVYVIALEGFIHPVTNNGLNVGVLFINLSEIFSNINNGEDA